MREEATTLRQELSLTQIELKEAMREVADLRKLVEALTGNNEHIKFDTEKKIGRRIISEILPELRDLRNYKVSEKVRAKLNLIEDRLRMIIPAAENPYSILILLSPQEIQIASMIKDGFNTSEIADTLNLGLDTIKSHRRNIRRKLHITGKDIELASYLKSVFA